MTAVRRKLTKRQKLGIIHNQNGRCVCGCDEPINLAKGDKVQFDHRIPLALGGSNDLKNFNALHEDHHLAKTKTDITQIAKAKRVKAKHEGTFRPARHKLPKGRKLPTGLKMNGGRDSGLTRKVSGLVEKRATRPPKLLGVLERRD